MSRQHDLHSNHHQASVTSCRFMFQLPRPTLTWTCSRRSTMSILSEASSFRWCRSVSLRSVIMTPLNVVFCSGRWVKSLICFQAPVFISFFIALRKMAYLPVPSLQTGGFLWFPDLTAADPFYILPLAVTGTMFFILEVSRLLPSMHHSAQFCCYEAGRLVAAVWHHTLSPFSVGCRVWFRQPQPASHEDRVQDHASYHPPPHHQLPYGQSVVQSPPLLMSGLISAHYKKYSSTF